MNKKMKLADIRPTPAGSKQNESGENKAVIRNNRFYTLAELKAISENLENNETTNENLVEYLLDPTNHNKVASKRDFVIKRIDINNKKAVRKIKMSINTHGETFQENYTDYYRGVCIVLYGLMVNETNPYCYGKPYTLEELAELVIETSPYRCLPRTLARRMSDLRLCEKSFSIKCFRPNESIEDHKNYHFILADNGLGEKGIITKEQMLLYDPTYKYLDWFRPTLEEEKQANEKWLEYEEFLKDLDESEKE